MNKSCVMLSPPLPQVSSQVLVNQWNNLVQTLVATVIADKPAAEKASDAELCAIAKRLTAVRFYLNDHGSLL